MIYQRFIATVNDLSGLWIGHRLLISATVPVNGPFFLHPLAVGTSDFITGKEVHSRVGFAWALGSLTLPVRLSCLGGKATDKDKAMSCGFAITPPGLQKKSRANRR
jgi:hypothetical protein